MGATPGCMRSWRRPAARPASHVALRSAMRVGSQFWVIGEHGMKAGYIRNIIKNLRVAELRSGILAGWHTGTAQLLAP